MYKDKKTSTETSSNLIPEKKSKLQDFFYSHLIQQKMQIFLLIVIIISFLYLINNLNNLSNKKTNIANSPSPLPTDQNYPTWTPTPTLPTLFQGDWQWPNQLSGNIQGAQPPQKLNLTDDLLSFSKKLEQNLLPTVTLTKDFTFYKVGTWKTGIYKDFDLLDVVASSKVQQEIMGSKTTTTEDLLFRITDQNGVITFFPTKSRELLQEQFFDGKTILSEYRNIPGLLPPLEGSLNPYYQKYAIVINNVSYAFPFYATTHFFDPNGYVYIASFSHGQKLYAKDQSGDTVAWNKLENPFLIADLDTSVIDTEQELAEFTFDKETKHAPNIWIQKPDLLSETYNTGSSNLEIPEPSTIDDIQYAKSPRLGCERDISIDELTNNSMLNKNDLTLVMTSGSDSFYIPTKADDILGALYKHVPTHADDTHAFDNVTYERFINSFPVLIWKNKLGIYQLLYRNDYRWIMGCGKPVIYLYPQKSTKVSLHFSPEMYLTKTEPLYQNGWNVIANPNGKIINTTDNKTYPYLFWEGSSNNTLPKTDQGFVIEKKNVKNFLQLKLDEYGLNNQEKEDFIDFWIPRLEQKPYYKFIFYTTEVLNDFTPLQISPKPDSILRILMRYQGLDTPQVITPQIAPIPFIRKGFTVVEWGGIFE